MIGAKIRTLRHAKGITQEQLAEKTATTNSYIGQLERGVQNTSVLTLAKVAEALEVDFRELFEYRGLPSHNKHLVELFEFLRDKDDEEMKRAKVILQHVFPSDK